MNVETAGFQKQKAMSGSIPVSQDEDTEEYTLDGIPVHPGASHPRMYALKHTKEQCTAFNLPTVMVLGGGKKPENPRGNPHRHKANTGICTTSKISSFVNLLYLIAIFIL